MSAKLKSIINELKNINASDGHFIISMKIKTQLEEALEEIDYRLEKLQESSYRTEYKKFNE